MSARAKARMTGSPPQDESAPAPTDQTSDATAPSADTSTQPDSASASADTATAAAQDVDRVDGYADQVQPKLTYAPTPAAPRVPPTLVYPPVAEARPSSRPVFAVAFAALLLLVAIGVLLVRQGINNDSDASVGPGASTSAGTRSEVISEVSFGPGLVLSESQNVVFDQPVSTITLTVPKLAATAGGGAFDPRIGNLQILVGSAAPINVAQSLHAGTSVTVHLPAATSRLDVVYVAYHAVVRSKPSSQHRAAALVTALTLTPNTDMTTTLHIDGSNVTNIGCTSPDGISQTCGSESAKGWTVSRRPQQQDQAVIAQLDLR
jgi:hypothetical protein